MKKTVKGFVLGIIITTVLMSTVLGAGVKKNIEVLFNSINLTVNGEKVDADTIVYKGTTYVPLRRAGEMLGKDVGWNGATNTASINDKGVTPAVKEEKPTGKETLSQKNAVEQAKTYLEYGTFSKKGLIEQLEYSKYSNSDATYAVNKITVDWKEQAKEQAKNYLEYGSFSREGLIDQLEFSGFTKEQAEYAADQVGY